jgi:hypothetical protein
MEFRIIKFQGTVFTPNLFIQNPLNFLSIVNELIGDKMNGNTTVLPIPQDAPADIPRIQSTSSDSKWGLNISLTRTDIYYFDPLISNIEGVNIEEFTKIAAQFLSKFQNKMNLMIQRLAFVTERILPEDSASGYLIDMFCKDELKMEGRPFNNVNKFEIHSLKKYAWNDFSINSWVRIKSIDFKGDKIIPAILLINDINTLPFEQDPKIAFQSSDIEKFFNGVSEHINQILSKYFLL